MKHQQAVVALKALAQDSRLAVYRLLVQAGEEGLAVGELAANLQIPGPTLTSHLNVLRNAGLVRDMRKGRVIRCRADYARMNALLDFLTDNCCAGDVGRCTPAAQACVPSTKTKRRSRHS